MAELVLHHARASECRDVEGFKAEMATLVTQARKNTITLEKVRRPLEGQGPWGVHYPCCATEQTPGLRVTSLWRGLWRI